ncbi:MAG: RNA-binding domain-containing protein [Bacteroidota bacterium]
MSRAEGPRFETKRVSGKMVQRALETVCAFSNTEGGVLIVGVEDPTKAKGPDRLYGLSENLEAFAELRRKLKSHFQPPIGEPVVTTIPIRNRHGQHDKIAVLRVAPGTKVHTILDDGTWIRVDSTNREMSAAEITTLSYKRGVVSAETELVDVDLSLIDTASFKTYCEQRGIRHGTLEKRLETIGLAKRDHGKCRPTKAAILLFADSPSDLLALSGGRAGLRIFHYSGTSIDRSEHPNLRKPPKNMTAPVYDLIEHGTSFVLDEITQGFEMVSGFTAKHAYPKRVIKEAITNAILHRDYRYPTDVSIRIFDDRIEVESPGEFPANITPSTIETAQSTPRNPSLVNHLREFPAPPNVDAGEGVPMMFSEMKARGLYPPRYFVRQESAIPSVTVVLLNEQRPAVWEQVSAFIDKNGSIANQDLRKIAGLETLQATRMLKNWVEKGLLVKHGSGKRDATYRKPTEPIHGELMLVGIEAEGTMEAGQKTGVEAGAEKRPADILKKAPNTPVIRDKSVVQKSPDRRTGLHQGGKRNQDRKR